VLSTDERVQNFIAHYSSANYDPTKAHEYYLKTRELKGRQSTAGMSDTQKEAWAYAKNEIGNKKKADLNKATADNKARLETLRKTSEATRKRIQEKLTSLIESLKVPPLERLTADDVPQVDMLPYPTNASPKVVAYINKQNAIRSRTNHEVLAEAQKAASEKHANDREKSVAETAKAREASKKEREKVVANLKGALNKARASYEKSKKDITNKYEATKNTEYNNIKTQLPGKPPPAPKKARAKSTKEKT
jgi:hypothetical protein